MNLAISSGWPSIHPSRSTRAGERAGLVPAPTGRAGQATTASDVTPDSAALTGFGLEIDNIGGRRGQKVGPSLQRLTALGGVFVPLIHPRNSAETRRLMT